MELCGVFGGLLAELMKWFPKRELWNTAIKSIESKTAYCILTGLMVLAGGGLVFMYRLSGVQLTYWLAVNLGVTAPLLLKVAVEKTPDLAPRE
jgi:hypothetical protein